MVSIIIPFYNEKWTVLSSCIASLLKQKFTDYEIILVDDGSTEKKEYNFQNLDLYIKNKKIRIIKQEHSGAGAARNNGVSKANGEILVFVDADMEFDKEFLKELIDPISNNHAVGTFSREEYLLNKDKNWAVLWNINRFLLNNWKLDSEMYNRMLPTYYESSQNVFRAIKKEVFDSVGGFDYTGYADDWSLSRKLRFKAAMASGAKLYHRNPESIKEVWNQAQWIGKNEFISGTLIRKVFNLIRYSIPVSVYKGIKTSVTIGSAQFVTFKLLYDISISCSIIKTFFSRDLYK